MQSAPVLTLSVLVETAVTERRFVASDNVGTELSIIPATGPTSNNTLGVALTDAAAEDHVGVVILGSAEVEAGEAITVGTLVEAAAGGKAESASTSGAYVVGMALSEAAADGDIIEVLLFGPAYKQGNTVS